MISRHEIYLYHAIYIFEFTYIVYVCTCDEDKYFIAPNCPILKT